MILRRVDLDTISAPRPSDRLPGPERRDGLTVTLLNPTSSAELGRVLKILRKRSTRLVAELKQRARYRKPSEQRRAKRRLARARTSKAMAKAGWAERLAESALGREPGAARITTGTETALQLAS